MINPLELDGAFLAFSQNLSKWVPDGVIPVNLKLLDELGLLNLEEWEHIGIDNVSHYFHVIETPEKVTLFNEQFAIWIVPKVIDDIPSTLTYIALLHQNKPHLEIVFSTTGVFNTPKYILKILQHFLNEVIDTEAVIASIDKKKSS